MEVRKIIILFNWVNFRFQLLLLQGESLRKLHESLKKSDSYANEEYPSNADIQTVTTKGSPGSQRKQFLFLCSLLTWLFLVPFLKVGSVAYDILVGNVKFEFDVFYSSVHNVPRESIWDPFLSSLFSVPSMTQPSRRIAINNLVAHHDMTVVIVAHRLSTVKQADKICVIASCQKIVG